MPRVLNARNLKGDKPNNSVYVGRPSKWGNPWSISKTNSREKVIKMYREYIQTQKHLLDCLNELKGKDLICWCEPEACHADILLELVNEDN